MKCLLAAALLCWGAAAHGAVSPWVGGYGDGAPEGRGFIEPYGLGALPDGGLLIAHPKGNAVRRLGPDRVIGRFAGSYLRGNVGDGGLAVDARLTTPFDAAMDPSGWAYFTDNTGIRSVSPGGALGTLLPAAVVPGAQGLAAPGDGFLYVALADGSNGNKIVRVLLNTGALEVLAGSTAGNSGDGGPALQAKLRQPTDVAVGPDGAIYVADSLNNTVRVIRGGVITRLAGGGASLGDGGPATQARLQQPSGVAVAPNGDVFIADSAQHRVRRVRAGVISTVLGTGVQQFTSDPKFSSDPIQQPVTFPVGLAVSPDGGTLYVGSEQDRVVWAVTLDAIAPTVTPVASTPTHTQVASTHTPSPTDTAIPTYTVTFTPTQRATRTATATAVPTDTAAPRTPTETAAPTLIPTKPAVGCDASGNGTISAFDAAIILQFAAGLRSECPLPVTPTP